MTENTVTTPTLVRAVRKALRDAFREAAKRFEPKRGALLYRPEGSEEIEVTSSGGFTSKPAMGGPEMKWDLVNQCFASGQTTLHSESDTSYLCLPMKRPPEGRVAGVLYFETRSKSKSDQDEEVFAMESLAARTGAQLGVLRRRLLSDVKRVLPTSDLVDAWTGVRKAGLEAFQADMKDQALSFLERAKNQAEDWGPCPELAQSLNDYGQALQASERLEEAKHQFERGLSILEQGGMEKHPQAIALLNNLGGVHRAQRNLKEAERLYQQGLEIMSDLRVENTATPALMSNLGVISLEMGDATTARVWFQQAVSSATRVFGEDHPATEKCRQKLADL